MSEPDDPLADARYVELQVTTHFSFLRGASSPEELAAAAARLGLPAIGITDRNSFGGLVRAWDAQKVTGIRTMPGARLDLVCGTSLLVYPTDKAAYASALPPAHHRQAAWWQGAAISTGRISRTGMKG
jgi:error-prone DNA polymerase